MQVRRKVVTEASALKIKEELFFKMLESAKWATQSHNPEQHNMKRLKP
jgi:hypothetical protein